MRIGRYIFPVILVLYLPAAADGSDAPPEEPPTPRTVKTQVKILIALTEQVNKIPLTIIGDSVLVNDFSFTWGDVFYGGPTLCLINVWEEPVRFRLCEIENMLNANLSQDKVMLTFPAIGGVLGFNIGGRSFLSAHLELAVSINIHPYVVRAGAIDLYPRVTAGPDFNLGGGWRISAEVDYFFLYIGFGLGVSYRF